MTKNESNDQRLISAAGELHGLVFDTKVPSTELSTAIESIISRYDLRDNDAVRVVKLSTEMTIGDINKIKGERRHLKTEVRVTTFRIRENIKAKMFMMRRKTGV